MTTLPIQFTGAKYIDSNNEEVDFEALDKNYAVYGLVPLAQTMWKLEYIEKKGWTLVTQKGEPVSPFQTSAKAVLDQARKTWPATVSFVLIMGLYS